MSAPDPKAWRMTETEIETVQYNADVYGVDSEEVQAPINAVARRRAMAELKALLADTYVPYVNQHYGGPAPTLLDADVIVSRIAAIEAEEA